MRIGIVGYSSGKFDEEKAKILLQIGFDYLETISEFDELEVVSGLTNVGIPGLAYEIAASMGVRTVGIACSKAGEYPCFPVDEEIIVGSEWGDESETFIDYIDCLIRVGGGEQSLKEVSSFRKKKPQAPIIEMELPRED